MAQIRLKPSSQGFYAFLFCFNLAREMIEKDLKEVHFFLGFSLSLLLMRNNNFCSMLLFQFLNGLWPLLPCLGVKSLLPKKTFCNGPTKTIFQYGWFLPAAPLFQSKARRQDGSRVSDLPKILMLLYWSQDLVWVANVRHVGTKCDVNGDPWKG